ncbi:hypothetical protein ACJX0J_014564, partial [Zea mays]
MLLKKQFEENIGIFVLAIQQLVTTQECRANERPGIKVIFYKEDATKIQSTPLFGFGMLDFLTKFRKLLDEKNDKVCMPTQVRQSPLMLALPCLLHFQILFLDAMCLPFSVTEASSQYMLPLGIGMLHLFLSDQPWDLFVISSTTRIISENTLFLYLTCVALVFDTFRGIEIISMHHRTFTVAGMSNFFPIARNCLVVRYFYDFTVAQWYLIKLSKTKDILLVIFLLFPIIIIFLIQYIYPFHYLYMCFPYGFGLCNFFIQLLQWGFDGGMKARWGLRPLVDYYGTIIIPYKDMVENKK